MLKTNLSSQDVTELKHSTNTAKFYLIELCLYV